MFDKSQIFMIIELVVQCFLTNYLHVVDFK